VHSTVYLSVGFGVGIDRSVICDKRKGTTG